MPSVFSFLRKDIELTRSRWKGALGVLRGRPKIDEALYGELESQLIAADVGVAATHELIARLRQAQGDKRLETGAELAAGLKAALAPLPAPLATDESWLVLDANTGQNAVRQVKAFDEALGLTGLIITKLDGTAKGGALAAIAREAPVPIRFIGIGEKAEDLRPFVAAEFVDGLFAGSSSPRRPSAIPGPIR